MMLFEYGINQMELLWEFLLYLSLCFQNSYYFSIKLRDLALILKLEIHKY